MYIIAGLGNPTKEYDNTRHNIGFAAIDALADKYGISVSDMKNKALMGKGVINGNKVMLLKPLTYMNLSGEAIRAAVDYYKIDEKSELIVIYDDISLDVGSVRIRAKGSAGGHNGIKSIISALGTDQFPRVKIGVGAKPSPDYDLADGVRGTVPKADQPALQTALEHAADAALCLIEDGVQAAESRFNGL